MAPEVGGWDRVGASHNAVPAPWWCYASAASALCKVPPSLALPGFGAKESVLQQQDICYNQPPIFLLPVEGEDIWAPLICLWGLEARGWSGWAPHTTSLRHHGGVMQVSRVKDPPSYGVHITWRPQFEDAPFL